MSHGLPLDWYEEHDGQRLVLNSERVAVEIASLHQKLGEATKLINEGSDAMEKLINAEARIRAFEDDALWPDSFPASPADRGRGEELFIGGYTWTFHGDDGPKEYKYNAGRWRRF